MIYRTPIRRKCFHLVTVSSYTFPFQKKMTLKISSYEVFSCGHSHQKTQSKQKKESYIPDYTLLFYKQLHSYVSDSSLLNLG